MTAKLNSKSVAAIVLAYSRLDTLKDLIESLKMQTRRPDEIIVLFQGSNEEIWGWLSQQAEITVFRQKNAGSAGGFSKCIQYSIHRGHDWTWIFDDDAIPDNYALEHLVECKYFLEPTTGFISSRIENPKGQTYMSPVPADSRYWYGTVLETGCVQCIRSTWLGLLVSTEAVKKCGLPIEEYFLWDEDQEFTARIATNFKCYCALRSKITHYQESDFDPKRSGDAIKYNYWIRNRVCTIWRSNSNFLSKFGQTGIWGYRAFIKVLTLKAPAKSILCLLYGIFFFRPKIRYLSNDNDKL